MKKTATDFICGALLGVISLVGCASKPTTATNYAAYVQQVQTTAQAQRDAQTKMSADLAAQAATCKDDACKIAIAGFRAMMSMGGGAQTTPTIAPPPTEPSGWDRALQVASLLLPLGGDFVQYRGIVENAKTQRIEAQTNATVSIAQTQAWEQALTAVGTKPSLYVGGDYTGGDKVGGDKVGGDKIDNNGTYNTGNNNRFTSPDTGGAVSCTGGASGTGGSGAAGTTGNGGAGAPSGNGGAVTCTGGAAGG